MRGEGQALALRAPSGRRGFKPRPMGGRDAGGLSYRRNNRNCAERLPNPANPLILEILLPNPLILQILLQISLS